MTFCSQCGLSMEQPAPNCPRCGAPVSSAPTQPGYPQQPPYPAAQQAPYPPQQAYTLGQPTQGYPAPQQPAPAQPPQGYPQGYAAPPQANPAQPPYNQPAYTQQAQAPQGQPYSQQPGYPPAGNQAPPPPPKKNKMVPILLIIIAVALAGIILAVVLLNPSRGASSSTASVSSAPASSAPSSLAPSASMPSIQEQLQAANESFAPGGGFEYLGLAYYLDDEDIPRDAYIPYGEDTVFEDHSVYSKNHGVAISCTLTRDYTDAADALSQLNTATITVDPGLTDVQYNDAGGTTADNDTVGIRFFSSYGTLPDGTQGIYVQANYADIRDDGYYMIVTITLYGPEYDDETAALLAEVNEAYAINLPLDQAGLDAYI